MKMSRTAGLALRSLSLPVRSLLMAALAVFALPLRAFASELDLEIPAITLWASDYAVMNTAEDTLDKVEVEGVVKLAQALAKLLREDLAGVANAGR